MLPDSLIIDNEPSKMKDVLYVWEWTEEQMEKCLRLRREQGFFKYKKMICVPPKEAKILKSGKKKAPKIVTQDKKRFKYTYGGLRHKLIYFMGDKEVNLTRLAGAVGVSVESLRYNLRNVESVILNDVHICCRRLVIAKYMTTDIRTGVVTDYKDVAKISKALGVHEATIYNCISVDSICCRKYKISRELRELK